MRQRSKALRSPALQSLDCRRRNQCCAALRTSGGMLPLVIALRPYGYSCRCTAIPNPCLVAQRGQCNGQVLFDGFHGNTAPARDLALAQAVDPHQHKHLAAARRQRQHGLAQPRLLLRALDRHVEWRRRVQQLDRFHLYVLLVPMRLATPVLLIEQVAGNAVEQRPRQALLRDVASVFLAGAQTQEMQQARIVLAQERLETLLFVARRVGGEVPRQFQHAFLSAGHLRTRKFHPTRESLTDWHAFATQISRGIQCVVRGHLHDDASVPEIPTLASPWRQYGAIRSPSARATTMQHAGPSAAAAPVRAGCSPRPASRWSESPGSAH